MRGVLLLALVAGCGPTFVKLEPAKVQRIDVALVGGGNTVCPTAGTPQLRALVTYLDHKRLQTRSRVDPQGTLRPADLRWTSDVGAINANAELELPPLQAWHDRPLSITVNVPGRPDVADRIVLVPAFDCDGMSNHDGARGGTGGDGAIGGNVDVALGYVDTELNGRLVLVRVVAGGGAPEYYLLDRRGPSAARFVVSARGGAGGTGETGMSGSSGSDGSSGSEGSSGGTCQDGSSGSDGGNGGDGGSGGDGGNGGNGGPGGHVRIRYPAEFPELANVVEIDVRGGDAGRGGSGGSGGKGGSGGRGGSGGSGGSTIDFDGTYCSTSSGSDGHDGSDGMDGMDGSDGASGSAGVAGTIAARPEAIDDLFGGEISDGWAIVRN